MSTRKNTSSPKAAGSKPKPARTKTNQTKAPKPAKASRTSRAHDDQQAKKASATDGDGAEVWTLRLYVTGRGERSERALSNLRRLCESNFSTVKYNIEVVDLLKNPERARDDQILAIPTLVRKLPEPMKRIIGDLSDADRAMLSLDFPSHRNGSARP